MAEYRNKTITKIVGSPYVGCYILALTIFSLSGFRDTLWVSSLRSSPLDHELQASGCLSDLVSPPRNRTDNSFLDALKNQPSLAILSHNLVKPLAIAFFAAGQIFVLSSMWALGVTGDFIWIADKITS